MELSDSKMIEFQASVRLTEYERRYLECNFIEIEVGSFGRLEKYYTPASCWIGSNMIKNWLELEKIMQNLTLVVDDILENESFINAGLLKTCEDQLRKGKWI